MSSPVVHSSPYSWVNLNQINAETLLSGYPDIPEYKRQSQKGSKVYHPTKPLVAIRDTAHGGNVRVCRIEADKSLTELYYLNLPSRLAHGCFGFTVLWVGDLLAVGVPRADIAIEGERYWRTDAGTVTLWSENRMLASFTSSAEYKNTAMFGRTLWLEDGQLKTSWTFRDEKPVPPVRAYAEGVIPYEHLLCEHFASPSPVSDNGDIWTKISPQGKILFGL